MSHFDRESENYPGPIEGAAADRDYDDEGDEREEIVSYKTVAASTPEELDEKVGELLDDGWEPHGSLVVTPSGTLLQPMIEID